MTETSSVKTAPLFTPESANRALPYVRAVVEDLVDAVQRLRRAEEARTRALSTTPSPRAPAGLRTEAERQVALHEAEDARRAAREALARMTRELEAAGVEMKDPETGLVDFPGEVDGRRVCLCWKRGEDSVAWWHEPEAGYRGRRPLPGSAAAASGLSAGPSPDMAPPDLDSPGKG